MAKLHFHFSTMNAGKSTLLLQASYNYVERGMATYLLTAQLDQGDIELIWKRLEAEPGTTITLDLPARTITCADLTTTFQVDDYLAWRLQHGYDDVSLTLQHQDAITAYEAQRPTWKPVVTAAVE